jgi:transcriptional regulator with XRE-family HTH domain
MENGLFLQKLGSKIAKARKEKNLTQAQLASMCNIDLSNFGRMERGQKNPHILTLKIISEKLDCNLNQLI